MPDLITLYVAKQSYIGSFLFNVSSLSSVIRGLICFINCKSKKKNNFSPLEGFVPASETLAFSFEIHSSVKDEKRKSLQCNTKNIY